MKTIRYIIPFILFFFQSSFAINILPLQNHLDSQSWYLKTADKASRLYLYEFGKGEQVLVLHGGPGADHQSVIDIAKGLENEFRFIFYDQRGSVRSYAKKEMISIDTHVEDIELIRKNLNLDKITIVGHSAGTTLAYHYLAAYPKHVKNLVLLGSVAAKNGSKFYLDSDSELWKQQSADMNAFKNRVAINEQLKLAGLNKQNLSPAEKARKNQISKMAAANIYQIDRWRQVKYLFVSAKAAQATQSSINWTYNRVPLLQAHSYPITVINGDHDFVVGPKGSPFWQRIVKNEAPNINLVILKNAGHLLWIDAPNRFRMALKKALN